MTFGWLLLADDQLAGTLSPQLAAQAADGWLLGWVGQRKPHHDARRCDPRLLDATGDGLTVSLLWPSRDVMPLFDDPAVVQARRTALSGPWNRGGCALVVDAVHFAGSLWLDGPETDPFRLVATPRVLAVGPGIFAGIPRPTGPALERYTGAPWPGGSFSP